MDALDRRGYEVMTERFAGDSLVALATLNEGRPAVRTIDAAYRDGSFYAITYALSGKMLQIAADPRVAVSGEWFTGKTSAGFAHRRTGRCMRC